MKKYGGFEGNAQTLRMITDIFYRDDDHYRGMNPTRAFVDGILKYKAVYKQFKKPENHFIYNEQKKIIDFVFGNKKVSKDVSTPEGLNQFQSIECQIMDWADDTAYAINDLVDSISGGFINIQKLSHWKESNRLNDIQKNIIDEIIDWIRIGNFKKKFGAQIGEFIKASGLKERSSFLDNMTNRYKFILVIEKNIFERVQIYKRISSDLVFNSSQLHQIEFKGKQMIENLFKRFEENYVRSPNDTKLLPDFNHRLLCNEKNKINRARMICDYISGSTDSHAMRIYRRLFDPEYSSLADLV